VGEAVKALREAKGWSQEALAQRLQDRGLSWTRSRVADLEIPQRRRPDLTLTELILLAETFGVRLADLLAGTGSVQLGNTRRPLEAVRARLMGEPPRDEDLLGPQDIAGFDPEIQGEGPYWIRPMDKGGIFYTSTEVEAARRLGVDVDRIHELARKLWDGRIIDLERNRRLRNRSQDRTELTSRLIEELRDADGS
jgi:transcriptional regulator with XRE-family HTH domain